MTKTEKIYFFHSGERNHLVWGLLDDLNVQLGTPAVLTRKHFSTDTLLFINYATLTYKDLSLLKFWKENNFLILLDLSDLYNIEKDSDRTFLRLCLNRAPVLFTAEKKLVAGILKGPIRLNKALQLFAVKHHLDLAKIKSAARKGAAFLFLKTKNVRVKSPRNWVFSESSFKDLYL